MTDSAQNPNLVFPEASIPVRKKRRGRPPGSKTAGGGQRRRRTLMNKAVFVDPTGMQTPVVRILLTLPAATTVKLDDLAARMGISASGVVACLIDELPTPHLLEPAPSGVPGLSGETAETGQWRPLWLPTVLGGKLARYLARTGHTVSQFVGGIVAAMAEPDLVAPPPKAFKCWMESQYSGDGE